MIRLATRIVRAILLCYGLIQAVHAAEITALDRYVAKPDAAYSWRHVSTREVAGTKVHLLEMVSQSFLTDAEVDRARWSHWLRVVVPPKVQSRIGLLAIGGGSHRADPSPAPGAFALRAAEATHTVVVDLSLVPNQPLVFAGEKRARSEDAIIAYSWDQFLKTGDEKWPLRLPMTKAAVRAMDAATAFLASPKGGALRVDQFIVTGESKRGWTTWSTAIVDPRVVAIMPVVFDALHFEPSFRHHHAAYGHYAEAVHDYVDLHIMDWMGKPQFAALKRIEDPYEYRDRLALPKLIVNAAGDQFFLPDSWRFYWDDLPGVKHLRYVPNAGHNLRDTDAQASLLAFHHAIVHGRPLPRYEWKVRPEGVLSARAADAPSEVRLWQVTNPDARDFRVDKLSARWISQMLRPDAAGAYSAAIPKPPQGWTAALIELTFPGDIAPHKFTTGVLVVPDTLPHKPKK